MFAQPPVHDVGVDTVFERDRCNGGANLAALANSLKFELWTVKPPLGDFGMSLARHDVHDLHRAHYRRGSARAQDVFTGRIRRSSGIGNLGNEFNAASAVFKRRKCVHDFRLGCRQFGTPLTRINAEGLFTTLFGQNINCSWKLNSYTRA